LLYNIGQHRGASAKLLHPRSPAPDQHLELVTGQFDNARGGCLLAFEKLWVSHIQLSVIQLIDSTAKIGYVNE